MKENQQNPEQDKSTRQKVSNAFQPEGPRDGFDNTGTQGYDSLKDDGYAGSTERPANDGHEDGTGSSSEDFHKVPENKDEEDDEDRALNSGI